MFLGILPVIALAIVAGATTIATTAIKAAPTSADKYRKERIRKLSSLEQQGRLGLTAQQEEDMLSAGMQPIQAAAREQNARAGDILATQDVGSGATYIQKGMMDASLRDAYRKIGETVNRADIQEANRQKDELTSLMAKQEQSQRQKRDAWAGAINDVVGIAGNAASAGYIDGQQAGNLNQALSQLDTKKLEGMGFSPETISSLSNLSPEQLTQLFQAYGRQ